MTEKITPKEKDYQDLTDESSIAIVNKNYQKAIELAKEALKLAEKANDSYYIELLKIRLEMFNMIPGDPEKSIREFDRQLREKAALEKSFLPDIKIPHAYHVFDEMINALLDYGREMEKWAADLDEKVHFPDGERWEVFMKYIDEAEEVFVKVFGKRRLKLIYEVADSMYQDGFLIPPYYDSF
ncbi:MAG: hypothetical protein ACTSQP_08225 [Promethearchaeota archaeon]